MTDKYADLRAALDAVPCVKWTASRSTVHIPETEDWAGKDLSITGLDKQVARKLARYIADTNPVVIRALLAERDAMEDALTEYANPENWEHDEHGWARLWLEPDSTSRRSYDGTELARAALAQGEA